MTDGPQPIELSYELTGTGWSAATVRIGGSKTRLTASYLSDALGDLLAAVQALTEGHSTARASWEEEPGEYRWVFDQDSGLVRVRVLAFRDMYDEDDDDAGTEVISGTVSLTSLVRATASAARTVLDDYGPAEYKRAWVEHPFPEDALRALEAFDQRM